VDLVRVDFALIPEDPLFRSVIDASQAITDEYYYNENIIDDDRFPPHLSLHICTVPGDAIRQLSDALRALVADTGLPDISPVGVQESNGGYVMANVDRTAELMTLHEEVLELAANARKGVDGDKYGSSYIRDAFEPHISLAKVDRHDLRNAARIGRESFGACLTARARSLDLCDIGARSERWDVLASLPAASH